MAEHPETDGHMDINQVREGAVLICPGEGAGRRWSTWATCTRCKVTGEIAGHTTDIAGIVTLQVEVIKGLNLDGPILLPVIENLPYEAKPLTLEEKMKAHELARRWEMDEPEEMLPVSFIGTGANLNDAGTTNGMQRAADVLDISVPEVMNRATITGAIEIGRHPGVVTVTFFCIPSVSSSGSVSVIWCGSSTASGDAIAAEQENVVARTARPATPRHRLHGRDCAGTDGTAGLSSPCEYPAET